MTPFLKLIQTGATAEVAEAVELDPALAEYCNPQGVSALLWAVYAGQPLVRDFLAARMADHSLALNVFEAAAMGDVARLGEILDADADAISTFSGDGWTPLHLAAAFGTPPAVSRLLDAGARIDAVSQNAQANQPLHAPGPRAKCRDDHGAARTWSRRRRIAGGRFHSDLLRSCGQPPRSR